MGRTESGFHETTDLDSVRLSLAQRPIGAWVPVLVVVAFGSLLLTPCFGGLAVVPFVGVFAALIGMGLFRPPVVLEIGLSRVRLRGWIGRIPTPTTLELPVLGTTASYTAGAVLNGVQVWVLTLRNGEETWVVPSLRCRRDELDAVTDRLAGMQALARLDAGRWEGEVPDTLDQLRGVDREEP